MTFIQLYEGLLSGKYKMSKGLCNTVRRCLGGARATLISNCCDDWFEENRYSSELHVNRNTREFCPIRQNILLLLACYYEEY